MAEKSSHRLSLLLVFLVVFIDLLGFGIVLPLLPRYGDYYGASPVMVGLLMAAFSMMQFLFAPIWGRVSDRGVARCCWWGWLVRSSSMACSDWCRRCTRMPFGWGWTDRLAAGHPDRGRHRGATIPTRAGVYRVMSPT
ncbi:MAG: MFS transporter [Planctomycetaceae bacterium]